MSNLSLIKLINMQKGFPSDSVAFKFYNLISQRLPIIKHKTQRPSFP